MPEIALGGLSALDVPPGKAKPARKGGGARRQAGPRLRKFRAHAALVVGSAAFSALMIGIVLNATVMQKEHHPAPLFGSAAPAKTVAQPASSPLPAAAPAPSALPVVAAEAAPAVLPATPRPVPPAPASLARKAVPAQHKPGQEPAKGAAKASLTKASTKGGDAITHLLGRPAASPTKKVVVAARSKPAPVAAKVKAAPVQPVQSRPLLPPT